MCSAKQENYHKPLSKNPTLVYSCMSRFDYQLLFGKMGLHSSPEKTILSVEGERVAEVKLSLGGLS